MPLFPGAEQPLSVASALEHGTCTRVSSVLRVREGKRETAKAKQGEDEESPVQWCGAPAQDKGFAEPD